jgi:hypothetical protein
MVEIKIQNWKHYTEIIDEIILKYQDPSLTYLQFRGQSNALWKLETSLNRLIGNDEFGIEKGKGLENHAIEDFKAEVHLLDSRLLYDDNDAKSVLFDMQHYSCPTRLLDWSRSPYVALYFTVFENLDKDGALFIWNWRVHVRNYKKYYPSYPETKGEQVFDFSEHDILELVFSKRSNERLTRQQGTFSVSNNILKSHDDLIISTALKTGSETGLYKLIISKALKDEFLFRLRVLNITPSTLFPGLDGLGQSIKQLLLMRKWKKI